MLINLLKAPFSFFRRRNEVLTIRETGQHEVPDDLGEAAIAEGYATLPEKPATKPRRRASLPRNAADKGQPAGVDRADLAPDDRTDGGATVADAG